MHSKLIIMCCLKLFSLSWCSTPLSARHTPAFAEKREDDTHNLRQQILMQCRRLSSVFYLADAKP